MGYLNYTAYQSLKNLFIIKENTTGSIMEFLYNETSRLPNGTREISLDFTALTTSARLSINPFVGNKLYIQSFRIIQLPDAPAITPPAELVSTGITLPVLATPTGTNMNLSVGTANSTIVTLTDTAKTLIFKPRIIPQAQYQLQFDIQWPAGSTQQQKTMQLQGISVVDLNTSFTAGANTALVNFVGGAIDGSLKLTFGIQGVTISNIKYTVEGSPVVMADSARAIKNTYSLSGNLWTTDVVDGNLVFTPNNATTACTLTRQFSGLVVGRTYRLLIAVPNSGAPTTGTFANIIAEGSTTPMFTIEANLAWQTITSNNYNTNAPRSGYSQVNGTGIKEYYLILKATTSSITINYLGAKTNANLGGRSLRHIKLIQEPVFEGYSENDLASGYRYGFGGHEKEDEVKGEGNHLSFGGYGFDTRIGRRWNVDPKFSEIAGISPYAYALNNPVVYIDKDGELPILPLLLKAGSAGAADMLTQAALAYFFDPKVESASQAFEKVNWVQVARSSAEGLIPWRIPGGKIGKAAATAVGDVLVNAVSEGSNYSGEQALQDFAVGFIGDLGGEEIGALVSKYGAKSVAKGLSKMGFDDKKIEVILTGAGTTWKGPIDYSDIADPRNAGPSKKFTQNQKGKILDKNQSVNNGHLRSDADGTFLNKSEKGGSDPLGAEIDHKTARSRGGTNSNSNAQVLSKRQNRTKSNE